MYWSGIKGNTADVLNSKVRPIVEERGRSCKSKQNS